MIIPVISSLIIAGLLTFSPVAVLGKEVVDQASTRVKAQANSSLRATVKADLDEIQTEIRDFNQIKGTEDAARQLVRLKKLGQKIISVRIKVLDNQNTRITHAKCPDSAKTVISSSLTTVKADLNIALTNLDAATTPDAAKQIIKDAVSNSQVFSTWVPASRGLCLSARLIDFIDGKLTTIVTKMKTAGLDTATIDTKITEAKTKAQATFDTYKTLVQSPKTTDAKAKFAEAKADLQDVRKLLGDIKSDIGNLKGDYQKKVTSTTTTTPATTEPTTTE